MVILLSFLCSNVLTEKVLRYPVLYVLSHLKPQRPGGLVVLVCSIKKFANCKTSRDLGTNWGRKACMDCKNFSAFKLLCSRLLLKIILETRLICSTVEFRKMKNLGRPTRSFWRMKHVSLAPIICSTYFEGSAKLSRNHVPSIFSWTTEKPQPRELKRLPIGVGFRH